MIIHRKVILFANQQFASLVGIEREKLLGRGLEDLVTPEFTDLVADVLRKRLADEPSADRFEVEIVGFQAQVSRLELNIRRIDYEGAPALLVTGVEIVLTSQVKALAEPTYAQELAESGVFRMPGFAAEAAQAQSADSAPALALDSIAEAIVTTDATGQIEYLNPAAERLIGTTLGGGEGQGDRRGRRPGRRDRPARAEQPGPAGAGERRAGQPRPPRADDHARRGRRARRRAVRVADAHRRGRERRRRRAAARRHRICAASRASSPTRRPTTR